MTTGNHRERRPSFRSRRPVPTGGHRREKPELAAGVADLDADGPTEICQEEINEAAFLVQGQQERHNRTVGEMNRWLRRRQEL
jgi:hypothetical protein